MNYARFKAIHHGMTAVAKKVYEAVPMSEAWSHSQIHTEIHRLGYGVQYNIMSGCLNSLIGAGLVIEPSKGHFKREPVREPAIQLPSKPVTPPPQTTPQPEEPMANTAITTTPPKAIAPLDRLMTLASRAVDLSKAAKTLANDIDDAAIAITQEIAATDAQYVKLRQLQALLKEV